MGKEKNTNSEIERIKEKFKTKEFQDWWTGKGEDNKEEEYTHILQQLFHSDGLVLDQTFRSRKFFCMFVK